MGERDGSPLLLHNRLQAAPAGTPIDADQPVVEVLNSLEIGEACFLSSETRESLRSIYTVENTYLDVFPHCLIGSFAVPNKNHILFDPLCFAFYFDATHLVFLDDGTTCARVLEEIASQGVLKQPTVGHCLFEFMKMLMKNDLSSWPIWRIAWRTWRSPSSIAARTPTAAPC